MLFPWFASIERADAALSPALLSRVVRALRFAGIAGVVGLIGVAACALPVAFAASPVPLQNLVVEGQSSGYLPAAWEVSPRGELTYAFPLDVPAGRAGMAPSLSLVHGGNRDNGIAGVGTSLSGLSSIQRCPRTIAVDGKTAGVQFDAEDAFCLDGARLVPIGGDGAMREFRTEEDQIARIRSYAGSAGAEPTHFVVWRKGGRIQYFEERVLQWQVLGVPLGLLPVRQVALVWLLSKEEDRAGNTITYEYDKEIDQALPFGAEYRIRVIRYTGRADGSETPRREIRFEYETRPDPIILYQAGTRTEVTRRLTQIQMWAPSPTTTSLAWRYRLSYTASPTSGRSLLRSVQRCGALGACTWPKLLQWQHLERPSVTTKNVDAIMPGTSNFIGALHVLDADGDGLDDALYEVDTHTGAEPSIEILLGERTAAGASALSRSVILSESETDRLTELVPSLGGLRPIDPSGAGRHSLYLGGYACSRLFRWSSNKSSFFLTNLDSAKACSGRTDADFVDVDGDGLLDMLRWQASSGGVPAGNAEYSVLLNRGGTYSEPMATGIPYATGARGGDFNGDGRGELYAGGTLIGVDANGALDVRAGLDESPAAFVDLNGDGLVEALGLESGAATVRWNTGNGFGAAVALSDTSLVSLAGLPVSLRDVLPVDVNDDGREDLFVSRRGSSPSVYVLLSRGDASFERVDLFSGSEAKWPNLGDFNGDGITDFAMAVPNGLRFLIQDSGENDVLQRVFDDEESGTPRLEVAYTRDIGLAAAGSCKYPQRCVRRGMRVVQQVSGREAEAPISYRFEDGRRDALGRGFVGFGVVREWVAARPAETTTIYDHQKRLGTRYPYANLPQSVIRVVPIVDHDAGGHDFPSAATARIVRTDSTYVLRKLHRGKSWVVRPKRSVTHEWDAPVSIDYLAATQHVTGSFSPPANVARKRTVSASFDDYENETSRTVLTKDGDRVRQQHAYEVRPDDWLVDLRIASSSVTKVNGQATPPKRTMRFTYDARGLLKTEQVEPDNSDPSVRSHTELLYDADGNLQQQTTTVPNEPSRSTTYVYDDESGERVFPSEVINAAGHSQLQFTHPAYGAVLVAADANRRWTIRRCDDLGRTVFEQRDGDASRSITFQSVLEGGTADLIGLRVRESSQTGAVATVESDALGRRTRVTRLGFSGQTIVTDTQYDAFGRIAAQSKPGFVLPGAWSYLSYDSLDRPRTALAPDATQLTHTYPSFFETLTRDASGHERRVRRDREGRVVQTTTYDGGVGVTTSFTYGSHGLLVRAVDGLGHAKTMGYDVLGRRISLNDPDFGLTKFSYNGFGEEVGRVNALGQTVTQTLDVLGRPVVQSDADGTTTFVWDSAPNGLGLLAQTLSPDGSATEHDYDSRGRPIHVAHSILGEVFDIDLTYDSLGRPSIIRYPEVPGRSRFQVQAIYNGVGAVSRYDELTQGAPVTLWQIEERTAEGALYEAVYGNDAVENRDYDVTGRLTSLSVSGAQPLYGLELAYYDNGNVETRTDTLLGRVERFSFDGHERLRNWGLSAPGGGQATEYRYDAIGNLADVLVGGIVQDHYTYGASGKPRALAGLPGVSFTYDARGRQIATTVGGTTSTTTYTAFDLPRQQTSSAGVTDFFYDAGRRRVAKVSADGEVVYVGRLYERRSDASGTQHVFHLRVADGHIAEIFFDETSATTERRFLVRDPQGSVAMVLDAQGDILDRNDFDPFGQRITANGLPESTPRLTPIGFTGHEHDDELGWINMNGRIYSPEQRRFVTPDPFVSTPTLGQNHNRYSYVVNNPLRYTDPSGFAQQAAGSGCTSGTNANGGCATEAQNVGGDGGAGSSYATTEIQYDENGRITGATIKGFDITELGSGESTASSTTAPPSTGEPTTTGAADSSTTSAGPGSTTSVIREGGEGLGTISRELFNFGVRSLVVSSVSDGGGVREGATRPDGDRREPIDSRPDILVRLGSWQGIVKERAAMTLGNLFLGVDGELSASSVLHQLDSQLREAMSQSEYDPKSDYLARELFYGVQYHLGIDVLFGGNEGAPIDGTLLMDPVRFGGGGE